MDINYRVHVTCFSSRDLQFLEVLFQNLLRTDSDLDVVVENYSRAIQIRSTVLAEEEQEEYLSVVVVDKNSTLSIHTH